MEGSLRTTSVRLINRTILDGLSRIWRKYDNDVKQIRRVLFEIISITVQLSIKNNVFFGSFFKIPLILVNYYYIPDLLTI